MKIGWVTMGDLLTDPITGGLLTQQERFRMIVEGAVTAEAAGPLVEDLVTTFLAGVEAKQLLSQCA